MDLKQVVGHLEVLAPSSLAESWDNVGLLLQPSAPRTVRTLLLTNDLTEPVLEEAVKVGCQLIVSYHPPLFRPLKRLTQGSWKERVAVRCLEEKIAVFSPHTSWDSVPGGINCWLVEPYGPGSCSPLSLSSASAFPGGCSHSVTISGLPVATEQIQTLLAIQGISVDVDSSAVVVGCPGGRLGEVVAALPGEMLQAARITKHELPPLPGTGAGRLLTLETPLTVQEVLVRSKEHLGLPHLRLALGNGVTLESMVRSIGVCAGSGASVLAKCSADLLLTGEMGHHEVLDFVHKGRTVVLTEHSNCERGYLKRMQGKLQKVLEGVEVLVSEVDRDPLVVF